MLIHLGGQKGFMEDLKGKVAIVTGASRGLGRDIAIGLAKHGAMVAVAARTETEKEGLPGTIYKTVEQIKEMGGKAIAIKTNVAEEESVQQMVQVTAGDGRDRNGGQSCLCRGR